MGQLEKYGLYVLCLVIFLILGVALWGEPASASESSAKTPTHAPATPAPTFDLSDFKELSSPAPKTPPVQPEPRDDGNVGPDASGGNGAANQPVSPSGGDGKKPEPSERRNYTIVGGDSFESIAKKELGDAKLVTLLRDLNPKVQPERMQVGKQLVLPSASELAALHAKSQPAKNDAAKNDAAKPDAGKADAAKKEATKPDSGKTAARTHRVEKGDTLEGIAKRYFGSEKRVDDIKKLNPTVDPTRMRIGQIIRLPD